MMPRRTSILKMGLLGLTVLAVVGMAAAQRAQPFASDRVLLLQAKRFEGSFKLASGETGVTVGDASADLRVAVGATNLMASIAPEAGKPNRATLSIDGRTVEGKAAIEGKTMTFDFVDGKSAYRIRLTLSGRNEGELSVTKNDASLVSGAIKRA